jgi:hypothetical protein
VKLKLRGNRLVTKLHLTRWGIVCLAVTVALASAGMTYARLSDKPKEPHKVVLDDPFTWVVSNDDGQVHDPDIDFDDTGPDPKAPQSIGENTCDRYDKDVASTTFPQDVLDDPYNIDITVSNAYPHYYPTVFFALECLGSVPGVIQDIVIENNYPVELTVGYSGIEIGDEMLPGEEAVGALHILVEQEATQGGTYTISVQITVACGEAECETAYSYYNEDYSTCFKTIDTKYPWGWVNGPLEPGEYTFGIYAGVGQCEPTDETLVGELTVSYDGATVTVIYTLDEGTMNTTHLYVGTTQLPRNKKGEPTVSPGQYPEQHDLEGATTDSYTVGGFSGEDIYIITHAVVCGLE